MPHLVGPPGCGKSTVVEQAAEIIGVNLHIINVSRLSPLEVEGVQMPRRWSNDMGSEACSRLRSGHSSRRATSCCSTSSSVVSRRCTTDCSTSSPAVSAGAFALPKVFIIGATNSIMSYDKALEDRLLHLPVPDPRKRKRGEAAAGADHGRRARAAARDA